MRLRGSDVEGHVVDVDADEVTTVVGGVVLHQRIALFGIVDSIEGSLGREVVAGFKDLERRRQSVVFLDVQVDLERVLDEQHQAPSAF